MKLEGYGDDSPQFSVLGFPCNREKMQPPPALSTPRCAGHGGQPATNKNVDFTMTNGGSEARTIVISPLKNGDFT